MIVEPIHVGGFAPAGNGVEERGFPTPSIHIATSALRVLAPRRPSLHPTFQPNLPANRPPPGEAVRVPGPGWGYSKSVSETVAYTSIVTSVSVPSAREVWMYIGAPVVSSKQ